MNLTQNSDNQPIGGHKRIEYIDALRGITMIMVVFNHVAALCWHIKGQPSIHYYLLQVRMPMFFFISGFVLYKASVIWNTKQIVSFFRKKIPVQLIAPFIFFLLYIHTLYVPIDTAICTYNKLGYWFTFVLFVYYVFYAIIRYFIRNNWSKPILLLLGCFLYVINNPTLYSSIPLSENAKGFLSIVYWQYFLFFVIGTLVKEYYKNVEEWLDSSWLLAICVLYYFLVNGFRSVISPCPFDTLIELLLTLTGCTILFSLFRINKNFFSRQNTIGKSLQFIGRRTLDIYLIHFFLLPTQLESFTLFSDHPMPIIEAACSLVISILIVAVCLLIGNIIRLSPLLAHYLFGAKYPNKNIE